jgi:hypothetical protein
MKVKTPELEGKQTLAAWPGRPGGTGVKFGRRSLFQFFRFKQAATATTYWMT